MPRPPKYPTVPQTPLTQERWRIAEQEIYRVERGTPQLLREVDTAWLGLNHADDEFSALREFHLLGGKEHRAERFVVMDGNDRPVAAWLDHDRLVSKDAYRLDFLKVRPDMQGRGLGKFVFGLVWLRARELNAERIVLQPVPRAESFFRDKIGAIECSDWKGGEGLPNLQVGAKALKDLEGILDEYRIKS